MKKTSILALVIVLTSGFLAATASPVIVHAQESAQREACIGTGGSWDGSECTSVGQGSDLGGVFGAITNVLLFLIGALSVIMIIVGGFRYVISGGDSNQLAGAKNTILYAVVGLAIAILAYAIVDYVLGELI